jgi:hypothetical protein
MGRPLPCADVVNLQHDMGVCFAMHGNPLVPDHGGPESVPLNPLGMANWAIPKFRVEVA